MGSILNIDHRNTGGSHKSLFCCCLLVYLVFVLFLVRGRKCGSPASPLQPSLVAVVQPGAFLSDLEEPGHLLYKHR